MNILWSLRKQGGLKRDSEIGISIPCFHQRLQQVSLRPLHNDVEYLSMADENHKRIPVNASRSYIMHQSTQSPFYFIERQNWPLLTRNSNQSAHAKIL